MICIWDTYDNQSQEKQYFRGLLNVWDPATAISRLADLQDIFTYRSSWYTTAVLHGANLWSPRPARMSMFIAFVNPFIGNCPYLHVDNLVSEGMRIPEV